MGHGTGPANRLGDGRASPIKAFVEKLEIDPPGQITLLRHDARGIQTCQGRVVLMYALDRHTIRRRACRLSQGDAPRKVRLVEQSGPIHRANNDG